MVAKLKSVFGFRLTTAASFEQGFYPAVDEATVIAEPAAFLPAYLRECLNAA
ncbi:MAG: hypothetical protein AAF677_10385 [Pseudomonadota bacterium]